jgi:hypothetical protein
MASVFFVVCAASAILLSVNAAGLVRSKQTRLVAVGSDGGSNDVGHQTQSQSLFRNAAGKQGSESQKTLLQSTSLERSLGGKMTPKPKGEEASPFFFLPVHAHKPDYYFR